MLQLDISTVISSIMSVVIAVIIAILAYFCKRLIDQNDKNFDKVSSRFDNLDIRFSKLENNIHVSNTALAVLEEKVERIEDHCPIGKTP